MAEWKVPCNPKFYKVDDAFKALKKLDWKQASNKMKIGDIVYIYVSKPVMAIRYKCKINKVDLKEIEIDDSAFVINGDSYSTYPIHMELEFLQEYTDELTMKILSQHGIKGNIQGVRRVIGELHQYIESI